VKLQPQPTRILRILVRHAGEVVTRGELVEQVWGAETYVDFDHGLNFAIRQIRTALGDDADHPHFVETLPKLGYRFVAAVHRPGPFGEEQPTAEMLPARRSRRPGWRPFLISLCAIALCGIAILFVGRITRHEGSGAVSSRRIESIAVLPLHNLSSDANQEFFSEGFTDELTTDIAKIPRLRVISHTSVARYKDTKIPLNEIARQLGVDAVVEGSVVHAGEHVRITAQLIDARTDQHLWAESYERDSKDVLALQDEVAQQIATEVGVRLTASEQARLTRKQVVNPAAHDSYLKANFYLGRLTCSSFEKAIEYYQDAAAKDPNFAPAYSGMADTYFTLADWRCWPQNTLDKAEAAVTQALKIDPESAQAHASLGQLAFYHEWNWQKAQAELTRAIALDPNAADAYSSYAIYLISMGRQAQALAMMRKAQDLDPVSENTNMTSIYVFYLAHQYDQAIEQANRTLDLYPGSSATYYWLGQCYEKKGMVDQAFAAYLKSKAGKPKDVPALEAAYRKSGLAGYWEEDLQLMRNAHREVDAVVQAMTYGHTGEKAKVLDQLELAYQHHCDGLQFLKTEPVYDAVREDRRYKDLLVRLRL
jgi:TolB-like protein/DNA-binding winged helix-turn-helix (wHTH) protein/Tfp pilus assembly protein PilF